METTMKQIIALGAIVALLGGCSSLGNKDFTEIKKVDTAVEKVPTWFIEPPEDEAPWVYGSGTGLSDSLQFSVDKAMHEAKLVVADKVSSKATSKTKRFISDNAAGSQSNTIQKTEKVSLTGFEKVWIPQYITVNRNVFKEGDFYRTYVLIKVNSTLIKQDKVAENSFGKKENDIANQAFETLDGGNVVTEKIKP